jgi:hypothetical protein
MSGACQHPTRRLIPSVAQMPLACLGHWYLSILYLAPVVIGGLSVVTRIDKRRDAPEAAQDAQRQADPAGVAR